MPDPPKKSMSTGAKVALAVLLGFLLLVVAGVGTCVVLIVGNPTARKALGAIPTVLKEGVAATAAPGAAELREAGCDEAGVMDTAALYRLVESFDGAKGKRAETGLEGMPPAIVFCQFSFGAPKLDCAQVASIYAGALPVPPAEVAVMVRVKVPRRDVCQGIYDAEGRHLRGIGAAAEADE